MFTNPKTSYIKYLKYNNLLRQGVRSSSKVKFKDYVVENNLG